MADTRSIRVKLQIYCGDEIAMGPGKADLLDAIAATGSISAGARAMGMSYRRAWMLVDTLNRCWEQPVVETFAGGSKQKGARLSLFGHEVLDSYRSLQDSLDWKASRGFEQELLSLLRDVPLPGK